MRVMSRKTTTSNDGTTSKGATRARILEAARSVIETEGASVPMERIAEQARVSRRAVYLHFESRAALLVALVAHVDEAGSLPERSERVWRAASGTEALHEFVALNARYNQEIAAIARALDEARERDDAARAAWEDRMAGRRAACRRLARWLADDGVLADGWTVNAVADLVWAFTNVPVWRDLVVERGWSLARFERHVTEALCGGLLRSP